MHTLEELKSGSLKGLIKVKIAENLTSFPEELFQLADTLEILDLSGNLLDSIPEHFYQFTKLKIAFFSENNFVDFPTVLSKCESLEMISFKSNRLKNIPENAFPPLLKWLILTNNSIEKLPLSIGKAVLLKKCALAGNLLTDLPIEMAQCTELELLRISANKLEKFPDWLFSLPKLAWIAFAGNSFSYTPTTSVSIKNCNWSELEIQEKLGEGASGLIYKANLANNPVAVKVFKGAITSDGFAEDEIMATLVANPHPQLAKVVAKVTEHPEQKTALVFDLIPPRFKNLGLPPSLKTCTRDTFTELRLSKEQILTILKSISSVVNHLHSKGILHGDLYAHNILISNDLECLLSDFGAATFYNRSDSKAVLLEKIEMRSFGFLIDDLISISDDSMDDFTLNKLQTILTKCLNTNLYLIPSMEEVMNEI